MFEIFLSRHERLLKNTALVLGLTSTVAIVQNWYPLNLFLSLPFCLIWMAMGWLHSERQLKWINILFAGFYVYGIGRYMVIGA
ncbi:MAG: peptidase [Rhodobacteraceae bacterium]|uniref:peptidase n=1 Tax=Celeribacter sp. HF31 TaxID=2721558 RepID=UPI00158C30A7|nr:peptidase [Celeribacter sp. HF31]NVK45348.1 peptidase [Paracoccaceae bacterium]